MTYFYIPHNAPHSRSLTLAPPSLRTALRPAGSLARSLTQIRLRSRAPPCRQNMRRALRALYAGASYTSDVCKHLHLRRFLHHARVCLTLEQTEAQQHRANLPASRSGKLLRDCQQPRDTSDERLPASRADAPCVTLCARGSAAGFGSPPVKAEPPPAVRIFHPSRRAVSWSIFMCHAQNGQRHSLLDSAPSESKISMVYFYRPQSSLKNVVRELPAHSKAAARCAAGYSDNLRSKRRRRFFRQPSG